jgi:hypothetical protein
MTLPRSAKLRGKRFRILHPVNLGDFGMCDDSKETMRIWIRLDQSPKDFLETVIHEAMHGCLPDTTEEAVTETAESIAGLLWKYGYRIPGTERDA